MTNLEENIRVGVAGWSYPDWKGYVYTREVKDQLQYLAGFVDMIEINNTFYRPPTVRNAESWLKRTLPFPAFFFSVKLHADITRRQRLDPDMVRAFHDGLAPLEGSGKLRHLLAQFPYDFADTPNNRDYLMKIKDQTEDIAPLVFELRHVSWQHPNALAYLADMDVTVAHLDYPLAHNSFSLQYCEAGEDADSGQIGHRFR